MNTDLTALIKYRMEQAHDTMQEAEILFEKHALRGTINRAYYAMFYALLALLATKKLGTSKHSGAISLFDREFVKHDIFSKEMSKFLRIAFDRRQTGDYGEIIEFDKEIAQETIDNAKVFIFEIERYLINSRFLSDDL